MRRLLLLCLLLGGMAFLSVIYCDRQVTAAADGRLYTDVSAVPHHHVGLLLGTSKYVASGGENLYYAYRIQAATQLMQAGKIDYIIVSGDNGTKDYNEPEMMRADLMSAGIDSSRIYLDYAGFRTFDSIIRLREIFSQQSAVVISQRFHNERALYIAQREGIRAVGFNAQEVNHAVDAKVKFREKLARVKVFIDYITGKEPKFLGKKVEIPG